MSTSAKQRTAIEKELLVGVGPLLKRTGWKKSSCALFNQSGDYYQDVFVSVHRNAALTSVELRFKPMALDTILWDILDIPENRDKPLSFRTWGAFTCPGLPILETQIEQSGSSAGQVAAALVNFCNANRTLYRDCLASATYSELVANHPNQVTRGAYAVTLVTSLINDHNYGLARQVANSYAIGELSSCANLSSAGKSFHQLAVEWLDAGMHSRRALHAAAGA